MATLGVDDAREYLSRSEVVTAVRALTDAEKTALVKVAMGYARRTMYGYEDLIQESILRVLDGRRPWPKGLAAVPFLAGIVRSVTWDWKTEVIEPAQQDGDPGAEERNAHARIDASKLLTLFDDDPIARRIVERMLDGARGEELQKLSGLGKTEYESKRTKIRRRLEKYFGPGAK